MNHLAIEEEAYTTGAVSATGRAWKLREPDLRQVMACMQQHELPQMVAEILVARGVALDEVLHFMQPTLKNSLPDPFHLLDMEVAAKRFARAIMQGETTGIFGDYDVDGATSSALLVRYLQALAAKFLVHIPDRIKEGYGPNTQALLGLRQQGAALVITVDCGTLAFEPIEAAANAGLDVVVIDHHQGEARKPKAIAVVNPNRLDESSEHRQLAAVGVTFLLLVATNKILREQGIKVPDLIPLLDIVALGTICDVVPLTGVNRALVTQGLKIMAGRENVGIRTLLDVVGVDEKPSVYTCGFILGPRINAGGRVGKSDLGVRLLSTEDPAEALQLARELDQYNSERKAIEASVQEEANVQAELADPTSPLLVVSGKGWHPGVIGIVAGRLKERYRKPVAVIAFENGVGKASARSVSGMDFGAAVIAACDAGLLLAGGGHAMAAGFSVEESKLAGLQAFLQARMQTQAHHLERERVLTIDSAISIGSATPACVMQLEQLGPFGQGNFPVRIMMRNVLNLRPEIVGESHVKTLLTDPISNARLFAISFRCADSPLGQALLATRGKKIDIAGQLRAQIWQGQTQISVMIEDMRETV